MSHTAPFLWIYRVNTKSGSEITQRDEYFRKERRSEMEGEKKRKRKGKMHVLHFKTHSSILVDLLTIVFSHEKRGLG